MLATTLKAPDVIAASGSPTVLIIDASPASAGLIQDALMRLGPAAVRMERVTKLSDAFQRLSAGDVDVVLLDFRARHDKHTSTYELVRLTAPDVLILPLPEAEAADIPPAKVPLDTDSPPTTRRLDIRWLSEALHYMGLRQAMTRRMTHLAQHDCLTGLPNRTLLMDRLALAISFAGRHRKQVALLFVDLDHFKQINDSLGHVIGDHVLKAVADLLKTSVRDTDLVSRQGGDEFLVLLSEIERAEDATRVAEQLLAAFAAPLQIDEHTVQVTLSIGISVYPDDGENADAIIRHADSAMYRTKANGRSGYSVLGKDVNARTVPGRSAENHLRRAFDNGEFLLHYQPQFDLVTGRVVGLEALIRWLDPDHGLRYPDSFVPLAEQCGLIIPIGHWVLSEACRQAGIWRASGLGTLPVSVNVSTMEFRQDRFVEGVADRLTKARLDPGGLELELTESIFMRDAQLSGRTLTRLKALGVRLAIDDFGTGYSGLNYLRRIPVDTLKIDESFLRDIGDDPKSAIILSSIIALGNSLERRIVAEGVETEQQLAFLRAEHCGVGQGFQLCSPLAADDCALFLATRNHQPSRAQSRN